MPLKDNSVDVVLMFDVIEHIPHIKEFLQKEVFRILKPDGHLVFQTPNKYINIPWEIVAKRSLTKWKSYHCSLQTIWGLKKMLKQAGARDIKIEKHNIITDHNKAKLRDRIGRIGIPLLYIMQNVPLIIFPNLWGYAVNSSTKNNAET